MFIRSLTPHFALLAAAILSTAGCQSTPREPAPVSAAAEQISVEAAAAARASARSAAAHQDLATAEALLIAGDTLGAMALYSTLVAADLSPADRLRLHIVGARIAIRTGDRAAISQALGAIDAATPEDQVDRALVQAWRLAAAGNPASAAGALMQLPDSPETRERVSDSIWELTTMTPPFEVLALTASSRGVARGWWSLRAALLSSVSRSDDGRRIRAWATAWPEHPAASMVGVLEQTASHPGQPPRIALLLPLSGPLARAGRATQDGFMAAWLELPAGERAEIAAYDTAEHGTTSAYRAALAEGAELIVGPLGREAVAELNALAPTLPVLALNHLASGDPAPQLVQLGLAIEDDVATLAQWFAEARLERVLVLHSGSDWAARVERALRNREVNVVTSDLLPEMRTYPESVADALGVDASETRHSELERLLGTTIEFTPRHRQDLDAIIALVNGLEVTALDPALRFHYADDIPTFVTSQTLQGASDAALRAMEGFRVVELPWLAPQAPGRSILAEAFQLEGNPFAPMYALGADALRLTDRIGAAERETFLPLLGHTGALSLRSDGRIDRELARFRVERGRLYPEYEIGH